MSSSLVDSALFRSIWEAYEESREDCPSHENNSDLYFRVFSKLQQAKKQFSSEDVSYTELGIDGGGEEEVWVDLELEQVEAELETSGVVAKFGAMVEACLEKLVDTGGDVERRETRRWIGLRCATRAPSSGRSSARRARPRRSTAWRYPCGLNEGA